MILRWFRVALRSHTLVHCCALASTDTDLVAIAQAARSGKLEWDTPMGRAHFTPDGLSGLTMSVAHVEAGKLVQFQMPELVQF